MPIPVFSMLGVSAGFLRISGSLWVRRRRKGDKNTLSLQVRYGNDQGPKTSERNAAVVWDPALRDSTVRGRPAVN